MTRPILELRPGQHLTLTPQLQQSIRLLQLSTLELEAEISQVLADNPLLERDDEPVAPEAQAESERESSVQDDEPAAERDAPIEEMPGSGGSTRRGRRPARGRHAGHAARAPAGPADADPGGARAHWPPC